MCAALTLLEAREVSNPQSLLAAQDLHIAQGQLEAPAARSQLAAPTVLRAPTHRRALSRLGALTAQSQSRALAVPEALTQARLPSPQGLPAVLNRLNLAIPLDLLSLLSQATVQGLPGLQNQHAVLILQRPPEQLRVLNLLIPQRVLRVLALPELQRVQRATKLQGPQSLSRATRPTRPTRRRRLTSQENHRRAVSELNLKTLAAPERLIRPSRQPAAINRRCPASQAPSALAHALQMEADGLLRAERKETRIFNLLVNNGSLTTTLMVTIRQLCTRRNTDSQDGDAATTGEVMPAVNAKTGLASTGLTEEMDLAIQEELFLNSRTIAASRRLIMKISESTRSRRETRRSLTLILKSSTQSVRDEDSLMGMKVERKVTARRRLLESLFDQVASWRAIQID